jgi:pimeloyl-ACP methyl ester carboxylesterase
VKVDVNGVELFFDVDGAHLVPEGPWMRERPVVVLVHTGPGIDHSLYKAHIGPELARDAQVIYLDQRGAGRSDWSSPEHWTLDTWVEDLVQFCDALELERPIVLGTGVGGVTSLLYAARHPERIERLVLVSTVPRYSHTRVIAAFDRLGGSEAGEVAARYFAGPNDATFAEYLRVCVPLYTRDPLPPDFLARMALNTALSTHWDGSGRLNYDVRAEAALVRCPTLVLVGEDDPDSGLAGGEELIAALPSDNVTYHLFPNTGHGVFRDTPAAMALVREFVLAGRPAQPAQ